MTKYQIRVIVEETNGDIRNTILDISVFDTDSIAESINQAQKLIKM